MAGRKGTGQGPGLRALLLGGGEVRSYEPIRRRLSLSPPDLVVCADAGLHHAAPLGVSPTHVIGDFDSVGPDWLQLAGKAEVSRHPAEKDETDLELAAEVALAAGATELLMAGVTGGRLDHTLGNVLLLPGLAARGIAARLLSDDGEAWVAGPVCRFAAAAGQTVSLLPLTPSVTGVSTRNLRYPLRHATLRWGSTLSLSNEGTGAEAEVRHEAGTLLILRGHAPAAGS